MGNYSKPIAELIARLNYHMGEGQMLAGFKLKDKPRKEIDGLEDLPNVALFIPTVNESYRPGGRSTSGVVTASLNLLAIVAVKRDQNNAMVELFKAVEKVLDAIETARDGTGLCQPSLDGTLAPFTASVTSNFPLDLSLNAGITITVEPKPCTRGNRRNS